MAVAQIQSVEVFTLFNRISITPPGESPESKYIHRDPVKGPPRHDLRKPLHPRDDPDFDDINENLDQLREDTTVSARQPPSSRSRRVALLV